MTVAVAAVAACTALVLAGTEAGEGTDSPDKRFADSVCATTIPHARKMLEIYEDSVRTRATPGEDGWYDLYALTYRAETVAWEYGKQIRALDIPDTESWAKIPGFIDWSSRRPRQFLNEERHRVFKLQRDFTLVQSTRGLNHFERIVMPFVVGAMGERDIVPFLLAQAEHSELADELADAFQDAPSCKKLDRVWNTRPT